ncbi:uncharacterized protein LOC143180081 [Calliopsis andreniformis]|uniref:uncharacterized protein LOC143180081 n=1 Tax=Calliopsis andreniformis TaxID=337506 RepID=UPI003FCEAFC7
MRNIEIKAKVSDPKLLISKIKQLTDDTCTILKQHDTFFKVVEGRLKLRKFEDNSGELLFYKRSNTSGPKLSSYEKTVLSDENVCNGIRNILAASNGCIGIVKKVRQLYMVGQTRVHVDEVEGLGNFMELEVVLTADQDIETGEKIAQDLMSKLGIKDEDLIAEAYIDLLNKSTSLISIGKKIYYFILLFLALLKICVKNNFVFGSRKIKRRVKKGSDSIAHASLPSSSIITFACYISPCTKPNVILSVLEGSI